MMEKNRKSEPSKAKRGNISSAVLELIRRQVSDRGLVVWYDPQKAYSGLVQRLEIPDCHVLRFDGSFFRLRENLEPFMEFVNENGSLKTDADIAPRVIVYVPMARMATEYALIESETAGVILEPDSAVPERNTRLGQIVEEVFKKVAPAKAAHLARQADDGLLNVEELDRMAGEARSVAAGALQIIFGHVSAEEILLQFVTKAEFDAALLSKSALPEVLTLIRSELGLDIPSTEDCAAVRMALLRYVLLSDLLLGVGVKQSPEALSGMAVPESPAQQDTLIHLCHQWRNRTDLKDAYSEAAEKIEKNLDLSSMSWPVDGLNECETFLFIEHLLLEHSVKLFLEGEITRIFELSICRGGRFWSRERPEYQLAWRVLESACGLTQASKRVRTMLRQRKWSLDEFIDAYALHADPWMQLDRLARDLETRYARLEGVFADLELFEPLMARIRETYVNTAGMLADIYATVLRQAGFSSSRHLEHGGLYHDHVMPDLEKEGIVAFFLVDALRYEMAVELIEGLKTDFDARIMPALGCLPGITSVGMAALMPGAEKGLLFEAVQRGVDVKIENNTITTRAQRMDWLASKAGVTVYCTKLTDVLKPATRRRKDFMAAKLIVVTSQEIDQLGEEGDEEGIKLYIVDVLEKLRRAVRVLAKSGVTRFIISADHGFIYAPGLDPGLVMDAPGGKTAELHPRAWIGEGGVSGEGFFRVKASDLAVQGPLELAFPLGMGSFRVKGGSGAYLHGGVSPAENILPVIRLVLKEAPATAVGDSIVQLSMAKPVITNRLFSVTVTLKAKGLFEVEDRRLRFEMVSGQKEIGRAATAAYGFEDGTGEVTVKTDQPNFVTFMLNTDAGADVTIRVLDCQSQVILDSLKNVPIKLGI